MSGESLLKNETCPKSDLALSADLRVRLLYNVPRADGFEQREVWRLKQAAGIIRVVRNGETRNPIVETEERARLL